LGTKEDYSVILDGGQEICLDADAVDFIATECQRIHKLHERRRRCLMT